MHSALFTFSDPEQSAPLQNLDERLRTLYGNRLQQREIWDPLTQLVYSLCASRTKTPVSHAALRALRDRFDGWPDAQGVVHWEKLRDAPVEQIAETIAMCTFPGEKAKNIKLTLTAISEKTSTLSLDFLRRYKTNKVREWLEQFPGVGSFVTAEVINFSMRRPLFVIDGHHQRVAARLGLAPENATAKRVEDELMKLVPPDWSGVQCDEHHQLVKLHGQTVCRTGEPLCARCALREVCPTGGGTKRLGKVSSNTSFV